MNIPIVMLNKIQSIINFIWGARNPRMKFFLAEKRIQDGDIAIPNIKRYYEAALLMACVEWRRMSDDDVSLLFEQEGCDMKLPVWLFANSAISLDVKRANLTVHVLGRVWLKHKKTLAPQGLLLQEFSGLF